MRIFLLFLIVSVFIPAYGIAQPWVFKSLPIQFRIGYVMAIFDGMAVETPSLVPCQQRLTVEKLLRTIDAHLLNVATPAVPLPTLIREIIAGECRLLVSRAD